MIILHAYMAVCKRNHELTDTNHKIDSTGRIRCFQCAKEDRVKYVAKRQIEGDSRATITDRLVTHSVVDDETGCWNWEGPSTEAGYGRVIVNGVYEPTHRVSYALYIYAVPDSLHLDHICENKKCINPDHVEPVTSARNRNLSAKFNLRPTGVYRRKDYCKHGHPWSAANTYVSPKSGARSCITCRKEGIERRMAEKIKKAVDAAGKG